MSEPVPDNLAAALSSLRAEVGALKEAFKEWREDVYERGLSGVRNAHSLEVKSDAERWQANEEAHKDIIDRLDSLNGWKNRIDGISRLLIFCAPLALTVWALWFR